MITTEHIEIRLGDGRGTRSVVMKLDTVIFGGGVAGLWLLDVLSRRGQHVVLFEAHELGSGQTIASQGILHGGLKYTLQGILTRSASQIREMPGIWRKALQGAPGLPSLKNTTIRSEFCYLWHTQSLSSRVGMLGARVGLAVTPEKLAANERPDCLAQVPGGVARLGEQVISPCSMIQDLFHQYRDRILKCDTDHLEFELDSPGEIKAIRVVDPQSGKELRLRPGHVVLTAGAGNAELRARAGLSTSAMQRRPLHMVLARGDLPELNGHCVDGAKTRVTITSDLTSQGECVWQIGGQVAEDGVGMEPVDLVAHAISEITDVLPGVSLKNTQWSTYRVDRAEGAVSGGARPENIQLLFAGNVTTGWPTKLVLAPVLAEELSQAIQSHEPEHRFDPSSLADWQRPLVAKPIWESQSDWLDYPVSSPVRHVA